MRLRGHFDPLRLVFRPRVIVIRNDHPDRAFENLPLGVQILDGHESCSAMSFHGLVEIEEHGVKSTVDVLKGPATGWVYHHRDHRAFLARHAHGASVLDLYAHTGAFARTCVANGATAAVAVETSDLIELAKNDCPSLEVHQTDVIEFLTAESRKFGIVVVDPPAFAPTEKKAKEEGIAEYEHLIFLAAQRVNPGGILFFATQSRGVTNSQLQELIKNALEKAGRVGRYIHEGHRGSDFPVHLGTPEMAPVRAFGIELA